MPNRKDQPKMTLPELIKEAKDDLEAGLIKDGYWEKPDGEIDVRIAKNWVTDLLKKVAAQTIDNCGEVIESLWERELGRPDAKITLSDIKQSLENVKPKL